jgi:hypothetical protein
VSRNKALLGIQGRFLFEACNSAVRRRPKKEAAALPRSGQEMRQKAGETDPLTCCQYALKSLIGKQCIFSAAASQLGTANENQNSGSKSA